MRAHHRAIIQGAVAEAITKAGSQVALAKSLDIWQSAVAKWVSGNNRPSPEIARAIESQYGIPRSRLRPDLWADS